MDAGLFGNYRPMGMGNITILLTLGKALFMYDDNPATRDLRDRGFAVHSLTDISTEFLWRLKERGAVEQNCELAERFFYGEEIDEIYRRLF
jgi:hypothetical protein